MQHPQEPTDTLSALGRQTLSTGAAALGQPLTEAQVNAFSQLQARLLSTNRITNLTAIRDEAGVVQKHFLDSLSCLTSGAFEGEQRVLDIGTGAGFPGLPLAIARPQVHFTLLDSTRKKIDFVAATAEALGLDHVTARAGRAETLGQDPAHRARYDVVVMRAVSALPVLAELALPFLRVDGLLVAQKGDVQDAELDQGACAARLVGGEVEAVQRLSLPSGGLPGGDLRTLVLVRKVRPTPATYPRREGTPAKNPLCSEPA